MCRCLWMSGKVRDERAKHKSDTSDTDRQEDGCTHTTRTHTTHTHILTQASCSQMRFLSAAAAKARREGEVELSDAAIRTTQSGRANKNEYFSPEISMGTYGGGGGGAGTPTDTHTNTLAHKDGKIPMLSSRLPGLFTSQSQMPQLSHQYHCVNDAKRYAHWTIVPALHDQCLGAATAVLLCEGRCNERSGLAARQVPTQWVEQRSHLMCNPIPFLLSLQKDRNPACAPLTHSPLQDPLSRASLPGLQRARPLRCTHPHTGPRTVGALPLVWVHCGCSARPSSCPAILGPISTWFIALKYHCTN